MELPENPVLMGKGGENLVGIGHTRDSNTLESVCNSRQKYNLNIEFNLNRLKVGGPALSLDPMIQSHHVTYPSILAKLYINATTFKNLSFIVESITGVPLCPPSS